MVLTLGVKSLRERGDFARCAVVGSVLPAATTMARSSPSSSAPSSSAENGDNMQSDQQQSGSSGGSGSGGGGGGRGRDIDSHTAVFRFNDAPTGGHFTQTVGRKTSLRVQNDVYLGWAERKGELCLGYSGRSGGAGSGRGGGGGGGGAGKCVILPLAEGAVRLASTFWMRWVDDDNNDTAANVVGGKLAPRRVSAGFFGEAVQVECSLPMA
jgi:hypothetical protein